MMNPHPAEELLPWYVNGSLSDTERAQVDAWLAESAEARAELAALQAIHRQVRSEALPPASELGWARLRRDLEAPAQTHWWRPALAAAAGLVLCLQVVILARPAPTGMALLGGAVPAIEGSGWLVQLEFADDVSWGQLAEQLSALDARLVDGPGSVGLVRVFIPRISAAAADRAALEARLQSLPGVVHAAVEAEH